MRVRRADGSFAERSVAQLSGGEWRRVGLALSLAFADFARARAGLSCNVLVLDEVARASSSRRPRPLSFAPGRTPLLPSIDR